MPEPSDTAVRALAHQILARPEFAAARPEPRYLNWIRWLLQRLTEVGLLRGSAPALYWLIVAALIVAIGALIAYVVWALRTALGAAEPQAQASVPGRVVPDLTAEAAALSAAGRHLEAAHRLMIASFGALAERSLIELRPDRSNRWIRGALRTSPLKSGLAAELETLVEVTERRWFGDRENDPEIYLKWRSAFERISVPQ